MEATRKPRLTLAICAVVMSSRGFGHAYVNPGIELFFNDQPAQLARWPNQGVTKIGKVTAISMTSTASIVLIARGQHRRGGQSHRPLPDP